MKRILTDPEAATELRAAAEWYEQQRAGLGAEFLASIDEAIATIQRCPTVFPFFKDTSIRKYPLQRFPYLVFYEEVESNIWIYAFAHMKRRPGYWLDRVQGDKPSE